MQPETGFLTYAECQALIALAERLSVSPLPGMPLPRARAKLELELEFIEAGCQRDPLALMTRAEALALMAMLRAGLEHGPLPDRELYECALQKLTSRAQLSTPELR